MAVTSVKDTTTPPPAQYQDPIPDGGLQPPDTGLKALSSSKFHFDPATVEMENFRGMSYQDLLNSVKDADDNVGDSNEWEQIATKIASSTQDFQDALTKLEDAGDWQGQTHDAMIANVRQSFAQPQAASHGRMCCPSWRMPLVRLFFRPSRASPDSNPTTKIRYPTFRIPLTTSTMTSTHMRNR